MQWIYKLDAAHDKPLRDKVILISLAAQVDRDHVGFSCEFFSVTHGLINTVKLSKTKHDQIALNIFKVLVLE